MTSREQNTQNTQNQTALRKLRRLSRLGISHTNSAETVTKQSERADGNHSHEYVMVIEDRTSDDMRLISFNTRVVRGNEMGITKLAMKADITTLKETCIKPADWILQKRYPVETHRTLAHPRCRGFGGVAIISNLPNPFRIVEIK